MSTPVRDEQWWLLLPLGCGGQSVGSTFKFVVVKKKRKGREGSDERPVTQGGVLTRWGHIYKGRLQGRGMTNSSPEY